MLTDSATGWHRETPKHLAHIMRWGRSTGASGRRDGGGMGGDGRSHWNMSVLMQPTEDVLDPAVTTSM